MSDQKTITFTDDVEVKDHNGKVEFSAKAGDVKSLVVSSADRWIKRNKAVEGKVDLKAEAADTDADDEDNQEKPISKMTISELQEFLIKHDAQFASNANKAELLLMATEIAESEAQKD